MDSPRSPAPFLLPPGEPPTWLFWLCPLCAGPTAIEGLGLPLKELLLGARFLPVNITETPGKVTHDVEAGHLALKQI